MTIRGARFPGRYLQGPGIIERLSAEISAFAVPAVLLLDRGVTELSGRLETICRGLDIRLVIHRGECSLDEVDRILAASGDARLIVGIGGGKTLDTAKSVASRLNIQVVIVPTIAASDAPCSALSVFYDNDGRVAFDEFLHRNPDLVLVDTEIIAQAPSRFLAAGIGDALATYYEAQACRRSGAANCMAVPGAAVAYAIARECREILFEHGREALADNDRQRVSHDLEQVIEANILLSGVGFESGGVAAAHAIHHGLAEMPETHHYLHGEKVALGILVGLILEQATQEFETVRDFLGQVRLPTSLSALGLHDVTDAQLQSIAARACREGEIMHNEPMPVTQADVVAALKQL